MKARNLIACGERIARSPGYGPLVLLRLVTEKRSSKINRAPQTSLRQDTDKTVRNCAEKGARNCNDLKRSVTGDIRVSLPATRNQVGSVLHGMGETRLRMELKLEIRSASGQH